MNIVKLILIFLVTGLFFSCKKSVDKAKDGYYVELTVKGNHYVQHKDSAFQMNAYIYNPGINYPGIAAFIDAGNIVSSFYISVFDTTAGNYYLFDSSINKRVVEPNLSIRAFPYDNVNQLHLTFIGVNSDLEPRFNVKVTNITDSIFSGEFSGYLKDKNSIENVLVTDGKFRLPLAR